jgi:selenocysteine lyase/cysteine desulfurase
MDAENVRQLDVKVKMLVDSKKPAMAELEQGVYAALETYSNVHRGNGHFSLATTHLFDQARKIILEYLGLKSGKHVVIFCTLRSAELLKAKLDPKGYQLLSCSDFGLQLGVRALVIKKSALHDRIPFHVGGGTARLMSKDWVVWAKSPDKFEAGTPAIINIIAFAKALRMVQLSGKDIFRNTNAEKLTAKEIIYQDELDQFSGMELLQKLRKTLIGSNVQVPTIKGTRTFINLDNSASTPTFTPVWNTFRQTLRQSEMVKQEVVQEVKSVCTKILGAPLADYEVIFTSNTTEAINLAAESLSRESDEATEPVVVGSLLEHSSNDLPWRMIPNGSMIRLSVDTEGFVNLNELETLLIDYNRKSEHGKKRIKLVAISGASNVLGVCNNLEEISRIVHRYGARLLVDAAQLVAHRKIDIEGSGIDYLAFSAHKVYAPFGSGALVVRKGLLKFEPEELRLIQASGEENAAGIAALGKSLVLLHRIGMDLINAEEQALTERALLGLAQIGNLEIYGVNRPESPGFTSKLGVIVFALKNKMATQIGKELAGWGGIGVRSGCHCAHITVKHILKVSPGLEKFQKMIVTLFPKLSLPGVVRVSFGIENTNEEVDTLIQVVAEIAGQPQPKNVGTISQETNGKLILKKEEIKKLMADFNHTIVEQVYGRTPLA